MFCGGHELGLTDADYEGAGLDEVLIFNEPHPDGQSVQEAFELDSVIFDIELTPNRRIARVSSECAVRRPLLWDRSSLNPRSEK